MNERSSDVLRISNTSSRCFQIIVSRSFSWQKRWHKATTAMALLRLFALERNSSCRLSSTASTTLHILPCTNAMRENERGCSAERSLDVGFRTPLASRRILPKRSVKHTHHRSYSPLASVFKMMADVAYLLLMIVSLSTISYLPKQALLQLWFYPCPRASQISRHFS